MPPALRAVHDEQDPFGEGVLDFLQRGDRSRDIGGGGDDRHFRIRLDEGKEGFGGDIPVRQRADVVGDDSPLAQKFEGTKHGIVFHTGCDDVIARGERSQDGDM